MTGCTDAFAFKIPPSPGGGVVLALEQELVPGQDDPLRVRGGRARPLEVEVVGLVGEDRRELSAVPEVAQPHLAAGEVGVQHAAQDFDAARGQALSAIACNYWHCVTFLCSISTDRDRH